MALGSRSCSARLLCLSQSFPWSFLRVASPLAKEEAEEMMVEVVVEEVVVEAVEVVV